MRDFARASWVNRVFCPYRRVAFSYQTTACAPRSVLARPPRTDRTSFTPSKRFNQRSRRLSSFHDYARSGYLGGTLLPVAAACAATMRSALCSMPAFQAAA